MAKHSKEKRRVVSFRLNTSENIAVREFLNGYRQYEGKSYTEYMEHIAFTFNNRMEKDIIIGLEDFL
ncbi:MAG: hypothetical protein U0L26_01530 [Cellulosilyticum sp.]|nr:hypothetical protein [Cellulosilyticum sp.]